MKVLDAPSPRFYDMDLYRFMAALIVVLFHYTFRGFYADNLSLIEYPYLSQIFKYGYLGVDLFFMISGFVILLTASNKDVVGFVISRVTRLYPAFWMGVVITTLVSIAFSDERFYVEFVQFVANLTMISGFFGVTPVDGVYWTLLVEIRFYVLIALILIVSQVKYIPYFFMLWSLLAWLNLYFDINPKWEFILDWSSYFIAGSIFYWIKAGERHYWQIVMLMSAYFLSLQYALARLPLMAEHYHQYFSPWIVGFMITFFYLIMAATAYGKTRVINKECMMAVGVLTYPLYLIYKNIGFMFFSVFGEDINKYILLLMIVSLMLCIAYFVSAYIEKACAKILKGFLLSSVVWISSKFHLMKRL